METETIIIVSVFSVAIAVTLLIALVLCCQVSSLRRSLAELKLSPVRVQKLSVDNRNHAFHNPVISPDEELSKRGYSMYMGQSNNANNEDVESGRGTERQTGGQFVEELSRELESRHQRQTAPPFLLQSIEDSKRRRDLANPVAYDGERDTRQSDTNPNFIY